jgi:hypothetical protein
MEADDWSRLRAALDDAGVAGSEDLGSFVSNTEHFRPSVLDERAAMPVFLQMLPTLTDAQAVSAVAGHLRRPWARPTAFPALADAYIRWTPKDAKVGWHLGGALATASSSNNVTTLVEIATEPGYGTARQMVVYALWRFKADPRVAPALRVLVNDPDVSLHAMSALRPTVGNQVALVELRRVHA